MIQKVKISKVNSNPNNPRVIKDSKFEKLKTSILEFPEMLELRPIVVDENNVILGGNMRYKACQDLGMKEVFVIKASDLTEEQKQEFIIKDNVGFGDWDWDVLANGWDNTTIQDWGLDVWNGDIDFDPNLAPETSYSDVTQEEIEREAKKLAEQMLKEQKNQEVMCPNCHHEFQVQL